VLRCPVEQFADLLTGDGKALGVLGHSQQMGQESLAGRPAGHFLTVLRKGGINQLHCDLRPVALPVPKAGPDDGLDQPVQP